ncbi:hypothetical protein VCHENC02_3344B, partial [Vibrio harveyi]
QYQEYFCH